MKSVLNSFGIGVVLVFGMFISVNGLRCYECKFDSMDNTTQPECESGDKLKASFLKECDRTGPFSGNEHHSVCQSVSQEVDGKIYITRGCTQKDVAETCVTEERTGQKANVKVNTEICYCHTDGCNKTNGSNNLAAPGFSFSLFGLLVLAIGTLVTKF